MSAQQLDPVDYGEVQYEKTQKFLLVLLLQYHNQRSNYIKSNNNWHMDA